MIFPFKTSGLLRKIFPNFIWKIDTDQLILYLTFDDGPIPGITEWVLEVLEEDKVPATFFCVGDNIRKHPEVFKKILEKGHRVGNHTFNHLSGWKTDTVVYGENIAKCQQLMNSFDAFREQEKGKVPLFRPPYGRIKKSQAVPLRNSHQVIMWDVLSGDFAKNISAEKCLEKTAQYSTKGSIVVFHDSIKTEKKLREVLPSFLSAMLEQGFIFQLL